mgnify:CR=1 FL=1
MPGFSRERITSYTIVSGSFSCVSFESSCCSRSKSFAFSGFTFRIA